MNFTELIEHLNNLNCGKTHMDCYSIQQTTMNNVEILRYDPILLGRHGNVVWFFCIKNEMGTFTSIVEFRYDDLVWYTLPEYRGNNILFYALQSGILELAIKRGWIGRITISKGYEFDASRNLALKIGFIKNKSESVSFDEYTYKN